jgi:hypothetical protein
LTRTRSSRPANDLSQYVILKHGQAAFYGFLLFLSGLLAGLAVMSMPSANAIPPQPGVCISGGGPFATFRDCDLWPDGSFYHQEFGGFIGYGGREGRVCDGFPPPFTDNDPTTMCPGVVGPVVAR